jgi:hypothetical protein
LDFERFDLDSFFFEFERRLFDTDFVFLAVPFFSSDFDFEEAFLGLLDFFDLDLDLPDFFFDLLLTLP